MKQLDLVTLAQEARIQALLKEKYPDPGDAQRFLASPQDRLGGRIPARLIRCGQAYRVERFLLIGQD